MATFAFFLTLFLLFVSILNYFTIKKPTDFSSVIQQIDVLIPVRNEENNIVELISTLKAQVGTPNISFIFVNDSSTDLTAQLITTSTAGDKRFQLINAPVPPAGWLGKPWALQQGYKIAQGEILVTLDADVRLEPHAIVSAVNLLNSSTLDFISPYPKQIACTFAERLIQPLLQWSWLTTVPLFIAEKSTRPSLAVANGQFFLVKRSSLASISGFQSNSSQVLDDLELARALMKSGAHGSVVNGSAMATTHMYSNFSELRAGYSKSLWKAFGNQFGALFVVAFLFISSIYPLLLALNFHPLGFLALEAIIASRLISARISRSNFLDSLLHPLSAIFLIYLIGYSWKNKNNHQWKGRTV